MTDHQEANIWIGYSDGKEPCHIDRNRHSAQHWYSRATRMIPQRFYCNGQLYQEIKKPWSGVLLQAWSGESLQERHKIGPESSQQLARKAGKETARKSGKETARKAENKETIQIIAQQEQLETNRFKKGSFGDKAKVFL